MVAFHVIVYRPSIIFIHNKSLQVASTTYREEVNTYKVKCGGSLEMWEQSGWMHSQDPYGWFQWYCR
jgi:hypothetical protein